VRAPELGKTPSRLLECKNIIMHMQILRAHELFDQFRSHWLVFFANWPKTIRDIDVGFCWMVGDVKSKLLSLSVVHMDSIHFGSGPRLSPPQMRSRNQV